MARTMTDTRTASSSRRQRFVINAQALLAGALVALSLPSVASAQQADNAQNTADVQSAGGGPPTTSRKKPVAEVVQAINKPDSNVGFILMVHYDGTIEGVAVQRPNEPTEEKFGEKPPVPRTVLGEFQNVDLEVYKINPNCITCKHGGSYYTICR